MSLSFSLMSCSSEVRLNLLSQFMVGLSKVQSGCLDRLFEDLRVLHSGTSFWTLSWLIRDICQIKDINCLVLTAGTLNCLNLLKYTCMMCGYGYVKPLFNVPRWDIITHVFVCSDGWVGCTWKQQPHLHSKAINSVILSHRSLLKTCRPLTCWLLYWYWSGQSVKALVHFSLSGWLLFMHVEGEGYCKYCSPVVLYMWVWNPWK